MERAGAAVRNGEKVEGLVDVARTRPADVGSVDATLLNIVIVSVVLIVMGVVRVWWWM